MTTLKIEDLKKMPVTKALLTNYIYFMYEEDAIIEDDYLVMEYNMLAADNRLDELFYQELLDSDMRGGVGQG